MESSVLEHLLLALDRRRRGLEPDNDHLAAAAAAAAHADIGGGGLGANARAHDDEEGERSKVKSKLGGLTSVFTTAALKDLQQRKDHGAPSASSGGSSNT